MTCTYNSVSQKLIVSNLVSTDTSGTAITFTCNSFLNPYSGVPRTGYVITTTDSGYYSIDTSSSATVTVSTMASLTGTILSRVDGITTVDELSVLDLVFSVTFPVDKSCRLIVYFPSDMAVTSDLTTVNGVGIFYTAGDVSPSINTASNYM